MVSPDVDVDIDPETPRQQSSFRVREGVCGRTEGVGVVMVCAGMGSG